MILNEDLKSIIIMVYREILSEKKLYPTIGELSNRVINIYHEKAAEYIAEYYLKHEQFSDFERIRRDGISTFDLEVCGIDMEFDKFDIMYYLDELKFAYEHQNAVKNKSQLYILGGDFGV